MSEQPIPWGALPFYQRHFIVLGNVKSYTENLLARTRTKTKGVMHKQIIDVWWEGGRIADTLNQDAELKELLKEVLLEEKEMYIDPIEDYVRIYSNWKPERSVEISEKALEAYDRISGHVKKLISELTVTNAS